MMATSAAFQQPTFVQMAPQPTTGCNNCQPATSMIVSATPAPQGQGLVTAPRPRSDPHQTNKTAIFGFGIAEIVMGGLSILLSIIPLATSSQAATTYRNQYSYNHYGYWYYGPYIFTGYTDSSPGIWGGIFIVVTGILAVRIKSNPSRCMYIANMIMAIVTACVTFSSIIVSGFAAGLSYYSSALIAIHVLITLLNFVSWIITIIHAAFCCRGVCCKKDSRSTHSVMYVPTQPNTVYPQQPQYVQAPNSQVMLAYMQQVPAQGYPQSNNPLLTENSPQQVNSSPPQTMQPPSYSNANTEGMEAKSPGPPNV